MPNISVRPMAPEDADGFYEVMRLTYNSGDPVPDERRESAKWPRFVAEVDGQIVGGFIALDLTCTRGEAVLRCGGIAAVGVLPHVRTAGVGKAMMTFWVRHSREQGIEMASLYGFSERYYRQFGYEVCGKRIEIKSPSDKLPRVTSPLPVRVLGPADWPALQPCYESFAKSRSGLSLRNEELWRRVLAENRDLTIYAAGEPVEGYAVVSHSVNFWSTDHISEIAWASEEGYRAILAVIRSISLNKTAMSWFEPSDSPYLTRYLDTHVETKVTRPVMYRVCDVPGAIRHLPSGDFEPFTLHVRDEVVPDNEGPWRISPGASTVQVDPAEQADLIVDVRQFAQMFLGEPSLADLNRSGLLEVSRPGALRAALSVFPASPVYCPDFF